VILVVWRLKMLEPGLLLLLAVAVAAVARASASVLQTWIKQAAFTRRLTKSLEGAKPQQRPDILMALGQVEKQSAGETEENETDLRGITTYEHHQLPALIFASKHVRERNGE
jgi:hypothetical protein